MFQSSGSLPEAFFEFDRIDFRIDLMIAERWLAPQLVKLRFYVLDAQRTKHVTSKEIYVAHLPALETEEESKDSHRFSPEKGKIGRGRICFSEFSPPMRSTRDPHHLLPTPTPILGMLA